MDLFLDLWVVSKSIEPNRSRQFPEPGHLALCITPCVPLNHTDSFVPCATALFVFHNMTIADRPHWLGGRPHAPVDQGTYFFHKSRLKHATYPFVDTLDGCFTRWVQSDGMDIIPSQRLARLLGQVFGERLAGLQTNFQR